MVTYESKFIGDFKLGDNIVFNLSVLKCLYKCRADGNAAEKRYLQKPITLLNISIIEALLYDFHLRINVFTREGVGLPQKVLDAIRSKKIDEFEKYIASARKNDFFDLKDTVFYEKLDELRKLRNRIHIQNTKNHFERDDLHAFSEARLILSEQALEQVIKTLAEKHPRNHKFVQSFELPWESHLA
ncbi:hypothetical protein EGJ57_22265 [Brucella anthropi]|uniref:hypothetical protein n=1 Tax=Brucella anthropi TaxID=529 RepID=UPI000F661E09|nr:hypothetical protein [Brucella anthropi]RRY16203.1 hypothetical protein EGJ57_22265 [Brucella anthropi]